MMALRCMFILYIVGTVSAVKFNFQEPHCSKYAFEEKILERLVKTDFLVTQMDAKVKDFETKITTMSESMKQRQDQLDNSESALVDKVEQTVTQAGKNVSTVIGDVQRQVERMSRDMQEQMDSVNVTMQNFLDNTTAAIVARIGKVASTSAIFFARNLVDVSPSTGSLMRFSTAPVNVGGAYDPDTGYFTAPYNGVYMFTVSVCVKNGKYIDLQIVVAGSSIAGLRHYESSGYDATCTSGIAMAGLKTGDKVWVKCSSRSSPGNVVYEGGIAYTNSFSGVLLHRTKG